MKIERYICDIKDCGAKDVKQVLVDVCFVTEQSEGRGVKPYIERARLDLCSDCREKYLRLLPLVGAGGQGLNDYTWRNLTTEDEQ